MIFEQKVGQKEEDSGTGDEDGVERNDIKKEGETSFSTLLPSPSPELRENCHFPKVATNCDINGLTLIFLNKFGFHQTLQLLKKHLGGYVPYVKVTPRLEIT